MQCRLPRKSIKASFPGTEIGLISVGSSVYMNVDGVRKEFLIVHHGNPDTNIYDSSCNGTWLIMKDCYENRQWHSSDVNDYANSNIHAYLNGTFLGLFDSDIQSAIKQVKIPYRKGSGYSTTVTSGSRGLSAKVFLLSATELAFSIDYMPTNEGATLSYFIGCAANAADTKRVAYLNGSVYSWWLRSPFCWSETESYYSMLVNRYGNWGDDLCTSMICIRPALILPSELLVKNGNVLAA